MSTRILLGHAADAAEWEADRIADAALRGAGSWSIRRDGAAALRRRPDLQARDHVAPPLAARLRALGASGVPLAKPQRDFFESRLAHHFGHVRVHTDPAAAETARELGASAFTLRNHIAFASGRYAPETPEGSRLLAHELVHVAQHAVTAQRVARASYGTPGPSPRATREPEERTTRYPPGEEAVAAEPTPAARPAEAERVEEEETEEVAVVRRQGPAGTAAPPAAAPSLATPSLSLAPGATLTRGDPLTATIAFTPAAGETLTVTNWTYSTPAHGSVVRPITDAGFQTSWSGVMVVSGNLVVTYQLTPAGGTARPAQTLNAAVTVGDRTGPVWTAAPTLQAEGRFGGQPSPPRLFRQLGRHNVSAPALPGPTSTVITSGPNAQLTYVSALTAGSYLSAPVIHPDLTTPTSAFYRFHLNPSRLYLVPSTGPRVLIPNSAYSGLSTAGGTLSFTVPNWEAFYKAYNFYRVTATSDTGHQAVVPAANWRLASNAQDAQIDIVNVAALRAALGIPASEGYSITAAPRGGWVGHELMNSAAILAGTRSHEYVHATHSHRANFVKMMRALDPQRKIESTVASPSSPVSFTGEITTWWNEIVRPDHELVDEAASRTAGRFVPASGTMAGVNTDPASGAFLGSVWDITGDQQMT